MIPGARPVYQFRFNADGTLQRIKLTASPENWPDTETLWFLRDGVRGCIRPGMLNKARYGVYYSESPDPAPAKAALLAKLKADLDTARSRTDALEARIKTIENAPAGALE